MSLQLSAELRWPLALYLGEGICWHAESEAWPHDGFFLVDIHGQTLHFAPWDGSTPRSWPLPERIGWIIPSTADGSFLVGLQSGVARIRLQPTLEVQGWICRPFGENASLRLNDAKADAAGRLWAGSLNNDDESLDAGVLMRIDGPDDWQVVDPGYKVANGPAISVDGRTLWHTDSARRLIYAFDLDQERGRLSRKRVWRQFQEDEGYPDGMTVDAEGALWVAHWGAGMVSRFDPEGRLLARARLPVTNVTNVAFGGPGLATLMATSARAGIAPDDLLHQPLAGGVFEIVGHGVSGLLPCRARM